MAKRAETYTVLSDGFINGVWRSAGDRIKLTEAQARLFLQQGRIVLGDAPKAAPASRPASESKSSESKR